MVSVGSNFEAIEALGTAKRWSKKGKNYICVARPALIGFTISQWVELIKWIKEFLPTDHLSGTRGGIGQFSCIASRDLYTIHGYYTAYLRKTVPHLNIYNQLQTPT